MKPVFKSLAVAGLLAAAGFATYAQGPGGMGMMDGDGHGRMGRMDPAKMEQMVASAPRTSRPNSRSPQPRKAPGRHSPPP